MLRKHVGNQAKVVSLLILLFGITYLDRVCISVAGPRMQTDLQIGPVGWGWVTGVFTIAYCLFEIPSGVLGDRQGPRRVLTRIVLWWSAFTMLTGTVASFAALLVVRFLFGAGEAGAFPNASIVVSRWFAPKWRATMSGVLLTSSQVGGALTPLLVVPIQSHYGWRSAFYLFGGLGIFWASIWYAWFRDSPQEKGGPTADGMSSAAPPPDCAEPFPWKSVLRSRNAIALMVITFCYVYVFNFFQTWFHTFLVKGRGFGEGSLWLSALPFLVGAVANLSGGAVSDALVRRWGRKAGRRTVGVVSLSIAAVSTVAAMGSRNPVVTLLALSIVNGAITFQQSGFFGVSLDIGGRHAGAVVGLMNTSAQLGGFIGSVAYGYLVAHFDSYEAPFVPMAVLLLLGAVMWIRVDASVELTERRAAIAP